MKKAIVCATLDIIGVFVHGHDSFQRLLDVLAS